MIGKTAFEPDARSRALLLGVRIAQQDFREELSAQVLFPERDDPVFVHLDLKR